MTLHARFTAAINAVLSDGPLYPADARRLVSCLPASGRDLDDLLGQLHLGLVPRFSQHACSA